MNRSQIIKAIQAKMSDVMPGNQIEVASHPFIDTLVDDCVHGLYSILPVNILPVTTISSTPFIVQDSDVKVYRIEVPAKYVKLVSFKLEAWLRSVNSTIQMNSARHHAQFFKYTYGGNRRPVVTLVTDPVKGRCLEYYTSATSGSYQEATCVVSSTVDQVPDNLVDVFTWYAASVALQAMQEIEASKAAMERVTIFIQANQ